MAITKLTKIGYGQLEINNAAFRRDGRVEAQAPLDTTDFATDKLENGMIVAVDPTTNTVKKATTALAADNSVILGIAYTAEHLYSTKATGLKEFALGIEDGFLPRIGFFATGDKYTTNTIAFDGTKVTALSGSGSTTVETLLGAGTTVYAGVADGTGYWVLDTEAPTAGVIAVVKKVTTMPDGQAAVQLDIVKA